MRFTVVPMHSYSTGNNIREGVQLKWQYGHARLGTLKRARGGDVSQGEDGEM